MKSTDNIRTIYTLKLSVKSRKHVIVIQFESTVKKVKFECQLKIMASINCRQLQYHTKIFTLPQTFLR